MADDKLWPAEKSIPTRLLWDLAMARIGGGLNTSVSHALEQAASDLMDMGPLVVHRDVATQRERGYPHSTREVGVEYVLEGELSAENMKVVRRKVG